MKKRELILGVLSSAIISCTRRNDIHIKDSAGTTYTDEPTVEDDSVCTETELIIPLEQFPELRVRNGNALVSFPESFVHVLIVYKGR